jgi:hypothetical protein
MLDKIFGLPTHALVVHAVVLLLPLAALGAVAVALLPPLRRRFGGLVAVLTLLAVAAVPVATRSGQHLYERKSAQFGPGDGTEAGLMKRHGELGEQLWPWAVLLLVGVLLVVIVPWYAARQNGQRVPWARWARLLGVAAVLVGGILTTVDVARIGHLGSEAVWTQVANAKVP